MTIEGSTIEEFNSDMAISSSITMGSSASAAARITDNLKAGASASFSSGLTGRFKRTLQTTESQYFLEITSENQSYWLILQAPEERYKEILSEEFKKDLYDSNFSPAQLFDKYGTHLLTSVAMGGNICMFYTFSSEEKETELSNYLDVTRTLKANVSAAFGDYGSASAGMENSFQNTFSYHEKASEYKMNINTSIESAGGDSYGINSEQMLYSKYYEWQRSLDSNPVLIGIKDSNSLYPIWELLDTNIPGASARYEELYNYFQLYGSSSYSQMCDLYYIIPPVNPTAIDEIQVNGVAVNSSDLIEIKAGDNVQIDFKVLPDDATKYRKTYSLADRGAYYMTEELDLDNNMKPVEKSYVEFDGNGLMRVSSKTPSGTMFSVKLEAGSVGKTISFYVRSSYNVVFNTRVEGLKVPTKTGIEFGSYIQAPSISREGYELEGWYLDAAGTTRFDFDTDVVEGNITLYAKWEEIKPAVAFNSMGGSDVNSQILAYKGKVTEPKKPVRAGYTFAGWFRDEDCTDAFDFNTELTGSLTLYAKWELITYTVSFVVGENATPVASETSSVETNYCISEPTSSKKYYTLEGWYTDESYSHKFNFSTFVTQDMTLYARWTCDDVVVVFVDIYGNTLVDEAGKGIVDQHTNYEKGFRIDEVNVPYREGHSFSGWGYEGKDVENLGSYTDFVPVDGRIVITAYFDEIKKYKISVIFTVDEKVPGAVFPENESREYIEGQEYSIDIREVAGYETNISKITGIATENKEIEVKYQIVSYTLYGSCKTSTGGILANVNLGKFKYGQDYTVSAPAIRGYSSNSTANGKMGSSDKTVDFIYSPVVNEVKLYKNPEMDNGEKLATEVSLSGTSLNVVFNESKSITYIPTAKYYVFTGWYTRDGRQVTDENGVPLKNVAGILEAGKWVTTEPLLLYAHWKHMNGYEDYQYITDLNSLKSTGKYLLVNDSDIPENWVPLDNFSGVFDGGGNTIKGLSLFRQYPETSRNPQSVGLIASTSSTANICNLVISDCSVVIRDCNLNCRDYIYAGIVVGFNRGTIENIEITNSNLDVEFSYSDSGLICGYSTGNIRDCSVSESYIGSFGVFGGIVGESYGCSIERCTTANVKYEILYVIKTNGSMGGIIGKATECVVNECTTYGIKLTYGPSDWDSMHKHGFLGIGHSNCSLQPAGGWIIGQALKCVDADGVSTVNVDTLYSTGNKGNDIDYSRAVHDDKNFLNDGIADESKKWFRCASEYIGYIEN